MSAKTAEKAKSPFAPPAVGDPYTYTVTYSGPVKTLNDDGSLVIGEHTVPRRTGNGVIMCMVGTPPDESDGCADCGAATDAVDTADQRASDAVENLSAVTDIVVDHHNDNHPGVFAFCENTLCHQVADQVDYGQ